MRIHIQRHVHALHLGAVLAVIDHQIARHHACFQNGLVVVDVVDKAVERGDTLHQAFLHLRPLVRRNDAGNKVERNQALSARAVFVLLAIHRKGNAHTPKNQLRLFTPRLHHIQRLLLEPLCVRLVVRPDRLVRVRQGLVHFVEFLHQHVLSINQHSKFRAIKI